MGGVGNTHTKHHTKNRRLKIEAVTKIDDCFIICDEYKTKERKTIEISAPISLEV